MNAREILLDIGCMEVNRMNLRIGFVEVEAKHLLVCRDDSIRKLIRERPLGPRPVPDASKRSEIILLPGRVSFGIQSLPLQFQARKSAHKPGSDGNTKKVSNALHFQDPAVFYLRPEMQDVQQRQFNALNQLTKTRDATVEALRRLWGRNRKRRRSSG